MYKHVIKSPKKQKSCAPRTPKYLGAVVLAHPDSAFTANVRFPSNLVDFCRAYHLDPSLRDCPGLSPP